MFRNAFVAQMAESVLEHALTHPYTKTVLEYAASRFRVIPTSPPTRLSRLGDQLIAEWHGEQALSIRLDVRVLTAKDGDPRVCECGEGKDVLAHLCMACWHRIYGREEDDDE